MEHGPVPPHERTWRHPSELAADEQAVLRAEPVPRSTRAFALVTGTAGLLAIIALVVVVTPSERPAPIAVGASTTAVVALDADTGSAPTLAAVRRPVTDVAVAPAALATPIGGGDYAVASRASLDRADDHTDDVEVDSTVDVVLPSGRVVSGQVVRASDETIVVALAEGEPGHDLAERRPHDREVVTVMSEPPVTVAFADISTVDVEEGTPIVDDDGRLIGLCSRAGDGTKVLEIDETVDDGMDEVTDDDTMIDEQLDGDHDVTVTPGPVSDDD